MQLIKAIKSFSPNLRCQNNFFLAITLEAGSETKKIRPRGMSNRTTLQIIRRSILGQNFNGKFYWLHNFLFIQN